MRMNNLDWANNIIKKHYQSWLGIDDKLEISITDYLLTGGYALDIGCGRRSPLGNYRDNVDQLIGTDLDLDDMKANVDIFNLALADGGALPFPSEKFNFLLSKTVIEHLEDPQKFFNEASRVLKPGGVFVWATSNLKSLPIIIARLTPLSVHKWVYQKIFSQSLDFDQFPTYFRANTIKALDRQLMKAGLSKIVIHQANWPQYFAFSRLIFRLLLPLHRWSEKIGVGIFNVHLIGVYRKA